MPPVVLSDKNLPSFLNANGTVNKIMGNGFSVTWYTEYYTTNVMECDLIPSLNSQDQKINTKFCLTRSKLGLVVYFFSHSGIYLYSPHQTRLSVSMDRLLFHFNPQHILTHLAFVDLPIHPDQSRYLCSKWLQAMK